MFHHMGSATKMERKGIVNLGQYYRSNNVFLLEIERKILETINIWGISLKGAKGDKKKSLETHKSFSSTDSQRF